MKIKKRKSAAHKGDYGRVFILAGSKGLTGAAHLAGMGAMRSGAGLVTVGVPEAVYPIIARREMEVMVKPFASTKEGSLASKSLTKILSFSKNQDVLAIGPGLSQNTETQKLIRSLISKTKLPIVLDADGLNAFKGKTASLKSLANRAILTPHPGEFTRVFGGKLSSKLEDRKKKAATVAKKYKIYMVLKGHKTIVASPAGKIYVNQTGNPGMASGGTGDVLTGIIASLLGQRFSFWDAARLGVHLHGAAGDMAEKQIGEISLIARDILQFLPKAIKKLA